MATDHPLDDDNLIKTDQLHELKEARAALMLSCRAWVDAAHRLIDVEPAAARQLVPASAGLALALMDLYQVVDQVSA